MKKKKKKKKDKVSGKFWIFLPSIVSRTKSKKRATRPGKTKNACRTSVENTRKPRLEFQSLYSA
jgi:hypothetical protein